MRYTVENQEPIHTSGVVYCWKPGALPGTNLKFWHTLPRKVRDRTEILVWLTAESQEPTLSSDVAYCGKPRTNLNFWCGLLRKARNQLDVLVWLTAESQEPTWSSGVPNNDGRLLNNERQKHEDFKFVSISGGWTPAQFCSLGQNEIKHFPAQI
jgi:hypothetical protein